MADQQQQQQQRRSQYDERIVACIMRIWNVEHDGAERILTNLSTIIEVSRSEENQAKRETVIKNTALSRHAVMLFQHLTRGGGTLAWVLDVVLETAAAALQRNVNPLQLYPVALERHQQRERELVQQHQARLRELIPGDTAPWPNKIADPDEITKVVSKDATAHADPGPVAFPPLRPTLTGGVSLGIQYGTPAYILPPPDDPSIYVPDIRPTSLKKNPAAEQHVRKKIQDLVSTVDASVKMDAEAEDLLLEIADEFIDSVANFACRLAKHRGSQNLDVRDLQLHLEMHHGIRIPGFSVDPPSQSHAASTAQGHSQAAAGGGGGGGAGGGGNKKGGGAAAAGIGAAAKRSSRLAAVNQAKKEARLL